MTVFSSYESLYYSSMAAVILPGDYCSNEIDNSSADLGVAFGVSLSVLSESEKVNFGFFVMFEVPFWSNPRVSSSFVAEGVVII